ncbi:MAG: ATP-binding protein [Hyphomicrobiales bacterium]
MRRPLSLQARLGLTIGLLLALLWLAAASVTVGLLRNEMDAMFDSSLQETAQRVLPLAVLDIVGREDEGATQRLGTVREHSEFLTYVVRDPQGRILLQSHAADPAVFPPYDGPGFRNTATHRIYNDEALQGTVRVSIAEPLSHRASVLRRIELGLGLPLLLVIPIAVLAILFGVRASLASLRRFREGLALRSASDLSPVPTDNLPPEIVPMAQTLNGVLARLKSAFESERSFAAQTAHELRTPLAGAIAQAQRLRSETSDRAAGARAADIETTLKRLTRRSERLMQLARAEGGRLRVDVPVDLRATARIVVDDAARTAGPGRIRLDLPARPVLSDVDPDAFGIACRNLLDNALRHGDPAAPVDVTLDPDGSFSVANDGPVVPPDVLARLTTRFERGRAGAEGTGLGLAIVAAIAERLGSDLVLRSPRPGRNGGFEALIRLPVEVHDAVADRTQF